MGPVAMVLTGFIVANYPLKEMVNKGRIYIAAVLRLFVLPAVFFTGLKLLGADRTTILMAFFVYATPLGLNTVVFPAAYGGDTTIGASMATISHTVCVLTIPLMFALLNIII
jgi:predicted permease